MNRRSRERRQQQEPLDPAASNARAGERRTGPRTRRGILGQRRRFLVPGSYQLRAILGVAGLSTFLLVILDFTIFQLQQASSQRILEQAPELTRMIVAQDRLELGLIVLASAVGLLAVVAIVLFESHKTAGPLYNLKTTMQKFAEKGGGVRVRFRRDDHFKELAEAFNGLAESLDRQTGETAARVGEMAGSIRQIVREAGETRVESQGLAERLRGVAYELDGIVSALDARTGAASRGADRLAPDPLTSGGDALREVESAVHAGR